jgi:hypothetical protein
LEAKITGQPQAFDAAGEFLKVVSAADDRKNDLRIIPKPLCRGQDGVEPNIKGGMPTHHCAATMRYDAARTRTMRDRPLYPRLPTSCCAAANRRSVPTAEVALQ